MATQVNYFVVSSFLANNNDNRRIGWKTNQNRQLDTIEKERIRSTQTRVIAGGDSCHSIRCRFEGFVLFVVVSFFPKPSVKASLFDYARTKLNIIH